VDLRPANQKKASKRKEEKGGESRKHPQQNILQTHRNTTHDDLSPPFSASCPAPRPLARAHALQEEQGDARHDTHAQRQGTSKIATREGEKEKKKTKDKMTDPIEGEKACPFSINDMVWAKVRGHPWWPAKVQTSSIFLFPSEPPKKKKKRKKKDVFSLCLSKLASLFESVLR